ncbi:SGNH/GDSL hydrolase family protein [Zhihengliuella halotolerans]|uniref:GDSL-like lipase/acylhydrolase family protein n=1 Tax=Zhihengliuella halotolerans TaxID=370736 RepID=A0A4Q8AGP5_9MICC|nr:GDSL-like lipase/acylhydrolase family protein [Zhihengliuella halotolerans]
MEMNDVEDESRALTVVELSDELFRGAVELERTENGVVPHRLPAWVRDRGADSQLLMAEAQPAAVRLAFMTDATAVELDVLPTRFGFRGGPVRPDGVYDVDVDGEHARSFTAEGGNRVWMDLQTGEQTLESGATSTLRLDLPAGRTRVDIWLPYAETTALRQLRTDGAVDPVVDDRPSWVHYGSSISQGSNAATAAGIWPVVAARAARADVVDLGFSGAAMLDPFVARVMRDTPADLLSLKVGINIVGGDVMRRRAFAPAVHGFLDTIREGHPETPILVVSPLYCGIHEETPGPGAFDPEALAAGETRFIATGDPAERAAGRLALEDVRGILRDLVTERAAEDPNLHYLDGRELYGPEDAERFPLPDRLHPDADAHRLIGARFAELALQRFLPAS